MHFCLDISIKECFWLFEMYEGRSLTFTMLRENSTHDRPKLCWFIQETDFDISWEQSRMDTMCKNEMSKPVVVLWTKQEKYFKMSSAELLPRVLSVKGTGFTWKFSRETKFQTYCLVFCTSILFWKGIYYNRSRFSPDRHGGRSMLTK